MLESKPITQSSAACLQAGIVAASSCLSLLLLTAGAMGGGCIPAQSSSGDPGTGGGTGNGSGQSGTGGHAATGGSRGTGNSGSGGSAASSGTSSGGRASSAGGGAGTGGAIPTGSGGKRSGSGGEFGSGGATSSGGAPPSRGPAPAQTGLRFPFPQNRENSRCIYPQLYRNEDVVAAYEQWKSDTVTTDGAKVGSNQYRRVKRPAEPGLEMNSTVSEGIGYGMLIAVYMGDQALFDDLWKYEQSWLDKNGLMDWYINGAGTMRLGTGGATDADEDMAFALLMADKQWGGMGAQSKTYLQLAKDQISKIWNLEVFDYKHVKPGDTWGDGSTINISYFAPYYYRAFAKIDTANASNWNMLLQTSYTTLTNSLNAANGNQNNGLVPAWCDSSGAPNGGAFMGGSPTNYQYDACRTPFRIGMDWCLFGETKARDYVAKTSSFFIGIGAANIVDGYDLNGKANPQFQKGDMSQVQSAAFVGPAGVGAMAMSGTTYQAFVNETYASISTRKLVVGGLYYDSSWTVLAMLMMTANFLDYTTY